MRLSAFGQKFAGQSGISALMEDLGTALSENPDMLFMGGGNPGRVEAAQEAYFAQLQALVADPERRHECFGVYQAPLGDRGFREELARYLRRRCGWDVNAENIAIANGSQSAFFLLANMFAGPEGGATGGIEADAIEEVGTIHLPMSPEYVGYRDAGLAEPFFTASRPQIEKLEDGFFKYRIDLAQRIPPSTRALLVSRPSNPTGNVISDAELAGLDALAVTADVPLIIDGAYGAPFPDLVYSDARAYWSDNTSLMLSLSKLGLPGVRSGIVIARTDIAAAFARANTVMSLASGGLGPALLAPMLRDGSLDTLCRDALQPFYRERQALALKTLRGGLGDLPVHIHRPEGAFFLWLWCEGIPVDSMTLYRRLKEHGVIVLPGQEFFIGTGEGWPHSRECLRLSYAGDRATIERGCEVVAQTLRDAYTGGV